MIASIPVNWTLARYQVPPSVLAKPPKPRPLSGNYQNANISESPHDASDTQVSMKLEPTDNKLPCARIARLSSDFKPRPLSAISQLSSTSGTSSSTGPTPRAGTPMDQFKERLPRAARPVSMASESSGVTEYTYTTKDNSKRKVEFEVKEKPRYPKTRVSYSLPPVILSIQLSTQIMLRSTLFTAASMAVAECLFLCFYSRVHWESLEDSKGHSELLLGLTYLILFLSLSVSFNSLLLLDECGEVYVRASQRESWLGPPDDLVIHEDPNKILQHYGARKTWSLTMYHLCFTSKASYLCVFVQLLIYVWVTSPLATAIGMTCIVGFSLLPQALHLYYAKNIS
ncbi:hypothetical protein B0J17DRAFT_654254 [Rhizoctonia solani]|nr:hypothetical protein B0J17DRAFT_654254 [Rhizoctonia solani]